MSVIDPSPARTQTIGGIPKRPRFWRPGGWLLIALAVATAGCAAGMFAVDDRLVVGILGFTVMLLLILLRTPIAVALIVPGVLGILSIGGLRLLTSLAGSVPYTSVASWSLSVLPMFILMGLLISSSGIATTLFRAAQQWLWWLPGGLAVGTNAAGTGLAAVSGSTMGTTYALGRVAMPEMLRAGYDKRVAMMAVMASGLSGQLIPPSILLVIYAGLVQAPVGPQLLAGIIPGITISILIGFLMFLAALVFGRRAGGAIDRSMAAPFGTMLKTLVSSWPVPVLIVVIVGGMFSGVFTATEAGAGAALVAGIIALVIAARRREWAPLARGLSDTVQTVGMVFLLLIGAQFLTEMFLLTGVSAKFQEWILVAGFDRTTFLLVMLVFYIVLGLAMETLPMLLLTIPVLVPTLEALDIPLIFFGVFVVLLAEIANLSPPVGILLYFLHSMFQDPSVNLGQKISLNDVFNAVWMLLPGAVIMLLLMIFFPELVMFLPDLALASSLS
ncbi:MAG: TRAP transporter large permease subunit [Microbacterium sp.]